MSANIIQCRSAVGTQLPTVTPWTQGEPIQFMFAPGGVHELHAGFRETERIRICVDVDEETPGRLQESFEHLTASTQQEPFADEDHHGHKATLRFPADKVSFSWGAIHGVEGVVCSGGEPTSYGAEAANGKTYRSFSPEFVTDADMDKAECNSGTWTFPAYVRGSAENPAKMVGVNFTIGALTNKPAFKAMPCVKAKQAEGETPTATTASILQLIAATREAQREATDSILQEQAAITRALSGARRI